MDKKGGKKQRERDKKDGWGKEAVWKEDEGKSSEQIQPPICKNTKQIREAKFPHLPVALLRSQGFLAALISTQQEVGPAMESETPFWPAEGKPGG